MPCFFFFLLFFLLSFSPSLSHHNTQSLVVWVSVCCCPHGRMYIARMMEPCVGINKESAAFLICTQHTQMWYTETPYIDTSISIRLFAFRISFFFFYLVCERIQAPTISCSRRWKTFPPWKIARWEFPISWSTREREREPNRFKVRTACNPGEGRNRRKEEDDAEKKKRSCAAQRDMCICIRHDSQKHVRHIALPPTSCFCFLLVVTSPSL